MADSAWLAVPADSGRAILQAAADGAYGWDTGPGGSPLLIIDLDGGPFDTDPPSGVPMVVVGISALRPTAAAPPGVDVALAPYGGDEPDGWVCVPDVGAALAEMATRVASNPAAATVLAQTLRVSATLPPDAGLVLESLAYATLQAGPTHARWLGARAERSPRRPPPPGDVPPVRAERRGDTLVVTLQRPHVRNAVDAALRDGLCEVLAVARADPSIAKVELRGDGPAFCSGGDLDEFGTRPDPSTAHQVRSQRSPARLLHSVADRLTVYLHGACIGAGIEFAAVAGRVVAAPDARITLPEVGMGLVPGAGGTVSIPRRIGRQRTAWLGLTGTQVDAGRAHRWGLVDRIEPHPAGSAGTQ